MIEANNYKYLLVTLLIEPNKAEVFEAKMRSLLVRVFEAGDNPMALGWKLLSAVKNPNGADGKVEYQHLWQLPRDNVLADAMILLGRDQEYYELDQCKYSEVQDVFRVAGVYSPVNSSTRGRTALESVSGAPLVVETVAAPADWFDLHEWQEAMPVIAASSAVREQLTLLFAMQAETGKLRRFINYWRPLADPAPDAKTLQQLLQEQKFTELRPTRKESVNSRSNRGDYPNTSVQVHREVDYRTP